jgi:hypothetical protein
MGLTYLRFADRHIAMKTLLEVVEMGRQDLLIIVLCSDLKPIGEALIYGYPRNKTSCRKYLGTVGQDLPTFARTGKVSAMGPS